MGTAVSGPSLLSPKGVSLVRPRYTISDIQPSRA